MAFTSHDWQTGEVIDAAKLNNINAALTRAASGVQAHYTSGTQSIQATTEFLIYLDALRYVTGTGFELAANGILCKLDGWVIASARLYCASGFDAGDQVVLALDKNSSAIETVYHRMQGAGGEHIVTESVLVPVAAGDVLKFKCQNVTGARGVIGSTSVALANSLTAHYLA